MYHCRRAAVKPPPLSAGPISFPNIERYPGLRRDVDGTKTNVADSFPNRHHIPPRCEAVATTSQNAGGCESQSSHSSRLTSDASDSDASVSFVVLPVTSIHSSCGHVPFSTYGIIHVFDEKSHTGLRSGKAKRHVDRLAQSNAARTYCSDEYGSNYSDAKMLHLERDFSCHFRTA